MFTGNARVNYLSTLHFDEGFLRAVQDAGDDVEVRQVSAESAADIDPAMWAQVDVLHTYGAFANPELTPRLRWIQLDTSGVDHVRSQPIWSSDIPITTIGGVSPVPLAEYVMWAILGTAHRLPALLDTRVHHQWPDPRERWHHMLPAAVRGATVGIVGYGRIGREIGRLAQAFGMDVVGVTRTGAASVKDHYNAAVGPLTEAQSAQVEVPAELVGPDRLHDVMNRSDYLVVVVPLTEQTANMIDAEALAHLKDQAVVVNVARGGIVDESALRAGLRSGRIRAAVLDVFDDEPLTADNPWWNEPNVFVTPHVSGLAPGYTTQVLDIVRENLRRFLDGRPLLNVVDRVQGY